MFVYRHFMIFAGVMGLLFGLGLLIIPEVILETNGVVTDASGVMLARLSGAVLVEAGLTQIMISGCTQQSTQKYALSAGLIGALIGLGLTTWMQVGKFAGPAGWSNVVVYAVLIVGFLLTLRRQETR